MTKKPAKPVKSQAKAKKSVVAKAKVVAAKAVAPKATAKVKPEKKAVPVKASAKDLAKSQVRSQVKSLAKAPAKSLEKSPEKSQTKNQVKAAPEAKVKGKDVVASSSSKPGDKNLKSKKANTPSVMGSKPKKDADDLEDEFLDDDIDIDPELAEFVEDVAELEEADAEAEKAMAGGGSSDDDEEAATPQKKTPKEKSASERRIKKERDLLSGIDRNGDLSEIWQKFFDTHKNEKPKQYNMRETFEAKSALQHVKLGWGFILSNINDRLEVLFKEGIKILISNYKS